MNISICYFPWMEFLRLIWCLELSPEILWLALNWFLPKHKSTFKILLINLVSNIRLSFDWFKWPGKLRLLIVFALRITMIMEFPEELETTQLPRPRDLSLLLLLQGQTREVGAYRIKVRGLDEDLTVEISFWALWKDLFYPSSILLPKPKAFTPSFVPLRVPRLSCGLHRSYKWPSEHWGIWES